MVLNHLGEFTGTQHLDPETISKTPSFGIKSFFQNFSPYLGQDTAFLQKSPTYQLAHLDIKIDPLN